MNKTIKWCLAIVCIVSMANFLLFLGDRSLFISNIDSSAFGLWDCPWCDNNNGGQSSTAGPSKQASPCQNSSCDVTVTTQSENSNAVSTSVSGTYSTSVEGDLVIAKAKASLSNSISSTKTSGGRQIRISTMTFHIAPSETIYNINCTSPQLVTSCTPVDGWAKLIAEMMENTIKPVMAAYGL